ncbi:unnamed protein product [Bathycoccus prasinos]
MIGMPLVVVADSKPLLQKSSTRTKLNTRSFSLKLALKNPRRSRPQETKALKKVANATTKLRLSKEKMNELLENPNATTEMLEECPDVDFFGIRRGGEEKAVGGGADAAGNGGELYGREEE